MAVSNKEMAVFLKILGMLGSDFDGERAVAAQKASEFLRSRNLQWSDVVGVPVHRQERPMHERYEEWSRQKRQERERPRQQEPFDDDEPEQKSKHQPVCLTLLLKYRRFLSADDLAYVEMAMRRPFLSDAQRQVLKAIIAKVKAKR